jgi:hypothetical protein
MMAGEKPFFVEDGQLCLKLKPALPGWLFDDTSTLSFTFLGGCKVVYHNPRRVDTFRDGDLGRWQVTLHVTEDRMGQERTVTFDSATIRAPYAEMVRRGEVKRIDILVE